jgi:DnaK suppressor protein
VNKKDLKRLTTILEEKRSELLSNADRSKDLETKMDPDDLPDEMDLASSEMNQYMSLRLRDRERYLLSKLDYSLKQIGEGTYGQCEECDEPIDLKRLEVRPWVTLCIRCKEEQERLEKKKQFEEEV